MHLNCAFTLQHITSALLRLGNSADKKMQVTLVGTNAQQALHQNQVRTVY